MDKPSSTHPHTVFILPEPASLRTEPLTLLILTDGNGRCTTAGGYSGGARRVVSIAEHLARRSDVAVMIACILSPDNIAKRGNSFFFALYKEFIQLGIDIETRRALVACNVRLEIHGALDALRDRGGHAVHLADAILAVVGATEGVANPELRLILGVGYGCDIALELDVDLLLRTGMEEPGVLRLSGLRTSERIANAAVTTLWPAVEPREVDELIDDCKRRAALRLARGYGVSAIVDLVEALSTAEIDAPVLATIPTSAPPAAISAAIERLFAGPLRGRATIAVEIAASGVHASRRYGLEEARHTLRIVRSSPPGAGLEEGEVLTVLAPGQRLPLITLPGFHQGHANVFACEPTAQGMLEAIRAAQRFFAAHPPLRGRDRVTGCAAPQPSPEAIEPHPDASERDALADRFAAKTLAWASSAGLLIEGAAFRTAAANYALTAFFIHFRIPTEWDEAGARWEERADLIARYMLLVAAGDEGIFDRVFEGETQERRWARLEVSSRFLQGALRSDGARARVPDVPGAELLAAIVEQWQALFERYRHACHPVAAASFRAGLEGLYEASLAEHRAGIASGLPEGERASTAAIERRFAATPPVVAARARAIVAGAVEGGPPVANELRVLLYLAEVGSAIGAGLLFRTAALAAPAASVTSRGLTLLDAAATLLDYHVRLSNDVSGFLDAPGGDRDPKENACTVLVSRAAAGVAREAAIVKALATCDGVAAWLGGEVGGAIERVAEAWPSMGTVLRRGAFVGRRVYEVGHYTSVSRAQMSRIFDEATTALRLRGQGAGDAAGGGGSR
jgi:hypothetical protein